MISNKERTSPDAATSRLANETAPLGWATVSKKDSITSGKQIASLLGRGPENGQTQKDLSALTGLNTRAVREIIEKERRAGAPILSDNRNGYYLAHSAEEVDRWHRQMASRASEILTTANAVREAISFDDQSNSIPL